MDERRKRRLMRWWWHWSDAIGEFVVILVCLAFCLIVCSGVWIAIVQMEKVLKP